MWLSRLPLIHSAATNEPKTFVLPSTLSTDILARISAGPTSQPMRMPAPMILDNVAV